MKLMDVIKLTISTAVLSVFTFTLSAQPLRTTVITGNAQGKALQTGRDIEKRNAPPGSGGGSGVATLQKAPGPTAVSTANFKVIAPSGASSVGVNSINSSGTVTGSFSIGPASLGLITDRNGNLTIFETPGVTASMSINTGGDVAGYYFDANSRVHGFIRRKDGFLTSFDAPNSFDTSASSINDFGDVTGVVATAPGNGHGFIRYRDGRFIVFDPPGSSFTTPMSINGDGQVTGLFYDEVDPTRSHAFVRQTNGRIIVFDPPGSASTGAFSINKGGDITGYFQYGVTTRGFIRYSNGSSIIFDVPNASLTLVYGINDSGDVTGAFSELNPGGGPGEKVRGFVRDRSGVVTAFDAPNATYTTSLGINSRGDTAGFFFDSNLQSFGFLRR
jgi:hypothetical protein